MTGGAGRFNADANYFPRHSILSLFTRYTSHMDKLDQIYEQFKVHSQDLADKVRDLIHEGNVRRIIIKDERGHTFMEIPLTVAAVGVILAPILAAVGAIATLVSKFDVVVERNPPATPPGGGTEQK
jgi:hypothetical protein